jgi:hypothetical protein
MTADCVYHPENLKPGNWYEITFRSALSGDSHKTYKVTALFKTLVIGESEIDNETGARLKLMLRVGQETCYRRISWNRVTKVVPKDV